MSPTDLEAARRALLDELSEIEALRDSSAESRKTVTLDQQSVGRLSRMDAMQGQAMAQAAERRRRARVSLIKAALQRIEDGEFGYCADCGDEIAEGRLRVDPTVIKCVRCAGR
jgi:DnaK suppressor protein